ncbi:MAG: XRE family transcriptional regulator [Bacteroidetes bacterium]|nr:MAG: XRE family transcriptional regulator [Bacteroidota bacterium]
MRVSEKEKRERVKFNVRIGNHIRRKRSDENISVGELARICFMEKPNLIRIEKGRVGASIFVLNRIAEGLKISLEELFKGF